MKKIAAISAILEKPQDNQKEFNEIISSFNVIVKGRMGIPFEQDDMAIVSIVVIGDLDSINSMTGKLGNLEGVSVKTAISNKEI